MRTIELCNFEKNISEINNNLSHTIFVFKQFSIDNKERNTKNPNELTTKIYTENEYSSQFNVKLKDIDEQAQNSLDYIFDTLFVFTNTQFEVYLKDVYLFIKENFIPSLPEPPDTKVYETILERLDIDIETELDNLFVSTFDYFRFRRNAIMHRHKTKRFQGALEDLVKGTFAKDKKKKILFRENQLNGQELDLKWRQYSQNLKSQGLKGYSIQNFNFSNRDLSKFSVTDLFDIFSFYRLYAAKLDLLILEKIEKSKLTKYCHKQYKEFYGETKEETIEKFSSRFVRISKLVLNLEVEEKEVEEIFNGV